MYRGFDDDTPPATNSYAAEAIPTAEHAPWRLSFMGLLRQLAAHRPDSPPIGHASRPQDEQFRIGQLASLTFAPREIAQLQHVQGKLKIQLFGLGMLGPNGALPLHFTEIVRERTEAHRDSTTADFLDLFHHRALTQFYQAWAHSQSTAGLDRPDAEVFSRYVGWLGGCDTDEIAGSPLPPHARLAASAHHVRESRSPDGISATLAHFFGVPVHLEEFVLHWIAVDPDELSQLGHPGAPSMMGQGAMLGAMVPDRQHKFRLVIGPLSLQQYLNFTPNGRDLPVLVEWVRSFVGYEFVWEVELQVMPDAAPPAVLGSSEHLGWSTWLGEPDPSRAITGMVFEPEQYATQ